MAATLSSTASLARVNCARPARAGRRTAVKVCAGVNERVARSKKSDVIVSPSILSADFANLGAEVRTYTSKTVILPCDLLRAFKKASCPFGRTCPSGMPRSGMLCVAFGQPFSIHSLLPMVSCNPRLTTNA